MKKIGVILIFAIAAFVFVGCGDEGTSLRWKVLNTDTEFDEIGWVDPGTSLQNQRWTGTFNDGSETDYKEITRLEGQAECLDGGAPLTVILTDVGSSGFVYVDDTTSSAMIEKNVDATLVIQSATAKK